MKHSYKLIHLFIILLLATGLSSITFGQPNATPKKGSTASSPSSIQKNQPVHIKHADHGIKKGDDVVLWGKVDIFLEKDQVTINADTVYYFSANKTYIAEGHAKITKDDPVNGRINSVSHKATFNQIKNQILLEGNPQITRGQDVINGDVIVITTDDTGSTIEISDVSAKMYPQEKPTTTKQKD